MKIDRKSRKAARAISSVQKQIQQALIESGKSQQEIADILGVNRSVVNRCLRNGSNLTIRTISDLAFAMNKDLQVSLIEQKSKSQRNTDSDKYRSVSINYAPKPSQAPKFTVNNQNIIHFERAVS